MSATKNDLPAEPSDEELTSWISDLTSDGPAPEGVAGHRATITSASWAPASGTVTALLAVTLTAPH